MFEQSKLRANFPSKNRSQFLFRANWPSKIRVVGNNRHHELSWPSDENSLPLKIRYFFVEKPRKAANFGEIFLHYFCTILYNHFLFVSWQNNEAMNRPQNTNINYKPSVMIVPMEFNNRWSVSQENYQEIKEFFSFEHSIDHHLLPSCYNIRVDLHD